MGRRVTLRIHVPLQALTVVLFVVRDGAGTMWASAVSLSDQGDPFQYIMHGVYYFKDRDSRSSLYTIPGIGIRVGHLDGGSGAAAPLCLVF